MAPVARGRRRTRRASPSGLRRIVGDDPPLAVDPGRDGAVVLHAHRLQALGAEPARRHRAEHSGGLVEHHDRRPAGAHHRAHLAHDGLRRLLQPDGLPQDLADGVEEIDLLVAAGQLLGEVGALPLGVEQRPDHRQHPLGAGAQLGLGIAAATSSQKPSTSLDRLEPGRARRAWG